MFRPTWFSRPGMASIFTPIDGIVHLWITSAAVTISRVSTAVGTTSRLSTSSSRKCPFGRSSSWTMKESNSRFWKSEYSYLQYHWWPIVLIVRLGWGISSIR